ncbi:telomere repeats-binding bouquet formation protein 2 [Conger conger]|uniref:telomere repeats-binding bouquet formation protein 2 n=1 Tax=Conger conger TaxID=82655 RepID=UPI002A5A0AE9|nr:telomere repeats-binding bouquet formation protein 2 [Conger conger]
MIELSEGGTIVSWTSADYLFSDDASSPDTQRIFESVDYAEDRVTVFHSLYLSACEKTQSTESVSIGHYVLPPTCIQKAFFGKNMALELPRPQNERPREETKISQEADVLTTPQKQTSQCCNVQQYPVNNMVTGYVFIDAMTRFSGELHDFLPGHPGFLVSKAHNEKYSITSDEERAVRCVK